MDKTKRLILKWLKRHLSDTQYIWLRKQSEELKISPTLRLLNISLGIVPRKLGKMDLKLTEADFVEANNIRNAWYPFEWSIDQAARVYLILEFGTENDGFSDQLLKICRTSDIAVQIAIFKGLPLYENQENLEIIASEGIRSNIRSVFESIAHNNPVPKERFDEVAWNQMILKAIFIESSLSPIQGLDKRTNPALAQQIEDYVNERFSAGRQCTYEIWRCLGPYAKGPIIKRISEIASHGNETERLAAALCLSVSPDPLAQLYLRQNKELKNIIDNDRITWNSL